MSSRESLSAIPSVESAVQHLESRGLTNDQPRAILVRIVREVLDRERQAILSGASERTGPPDNIRQAILTEVEAEVGRSAARSLIPVVNATGVVIHTNLGRAPLSEEAIAAVSEVARGYSNLEYDLGLGGRGKRHLLVRDALCELTGADDALVVNNNAAAVLLALNTLASAREVIVSRGELIEIGDSFRLPSVFERSGSRMVEVGTTNRTRIGDFEAAIRSSTGAILSAHWSNYSITGFVQRVALPELVALGERYGIPVIHDLGSGVLADPEPLGLRGEMTVRESVGAGSTVSTFSGDKLLGGPQAGIVVGKASAVARMRSNPLMRALRPDKMTLAALQATLLCYLRGDADRVVPVLRSILEPQDALKERAERLAGALRPQLGGAATVSTLELEARVGGGAAPERVVPSYGVELRPASLSPDRVTAGMLECSPPVVARTSDDRVIIDLRTVREDQDRLVERAVLSAFGET